MMFDFGGDLETEEDTQLHLNQPQHQEAIKALLADNPQLFLQILVQHKQGHFTLNPQTALNERLSLHQNEAKAQFQKLFTQKFSELLMGSEDRGRFFETPAQISLHNYARQQYLEEKAKMKISDGIINAYKDIFRRISQVDDLVYLIDLMFGASINLQKLSFNSFMEDKCRQAIESEGMVESDLQILKNRSSLTEEDQLIIKYCFYVIISMLSRKPKGPVVEKILQETRYALKEKPMKRLCSICALLDPFIFVSTILELDNNPREIIQYDFKHNQCRLNSANLHPELRGHLTFSEYFKKLKNLEQLVQKYEIIAHSSKIQDKKVLLGLNYDLLSYDVDIGYEYTMKVSSKTIHQYIDFLHLLTEHISCEFIPIQEYREDKYFNIMYACKAFELFVSLNKIRNVRSEPFVYEHLMIGWARLFIKWSQNQQISSKEFFDKALQAFFFLFSNIDREEEFPNLVNFESQLSKALFQLLVKLAKYPCQSNTFKGIRGIIFRWSMQLLPETQQLKNVLKKFMTCFFDDSLVIKVLGRQDVFETPALCRTVKRTIGTEMIDHITQRYQAIEIEKINSSYHPSAKSHNIFFSKLGLLITSRILGEHVEAFAFNCLRFYMRYAHVWPILHSYRMWILQICKDTNVQKFETKIEYMRDLYTKMLDQIRRQTKQQKDDWNNLSIETMELYNGFQTEANFQINCLRLKKNKYTLSRQVYQKYFDFLLQFEAGIDSFNQISGQKCSILEQLRQDINLQKNLNSILQEFKITFRYAICNSTRFLGVPEQVSIMSCLGGILERTVDSKPLPKDLRWKFICDIFGLNDLTFKTKINRKQNMGPLQKYTAKLNSKMDTFIPFNIALAFYSAIRPTYKTTLRFILDSLVDNQEHEELLLITEKIFLPSVIISGSCVFNGQNHEKTKEDQAFGLFYDQFERITQVLTDPATLKSNIKIVIMLQKKKKIFSGFYEVLRSKQSKIIERARPQNQGYNRYRSRNMSPEDVINAMSQMGVSREQAQIALDHIQYPDQNLAMDWIDNNQERLEELIVTRTMQRTRTDIFRRQANNQPFPQIGENHIAPLPFERFYQKQKMIKLSRSWIKLVFKELFKEENYKESQTLKNLMFMFMDSLKPDTYQTQYNNLNEKLYLDIDDLNKQEKIPEKVILLLNILQGSFLKTERAKNDFYSKAVNLKIISYLPRVQTEEAVVKIFSLLNATLPVFSPNDELAADLENYLSYLLDLILQYRNTDKSQCQIMLKIAKTGKQELMQRITRNLTIFFKEKLIKQSIFSLINMILTSDKDLSNVNAQLDLKTYLYERYKHRMTSFQPDKEHVLEVDIGEFQRSFQKYDRGSSIYDVSKVLLAKKKNKNKLLYYDCRKQLNEFNYSHFGKCNFISYPLKDHFKTMIRSLLATLFEAKDQETEEQMLTDLFKLLENYRILLPFAVHEKVEGTNLIDWLLFSNNHSKRKFKFLTFLTLNVNLSIKKQQYSFWSFSDYICAKIIKSLMAQQSDLIWKSFSVLYLSQVRMFSEYCTASTSLDNKNTMVSYFQNMLPRIGPLQYINISEFLYVQYKKTILDNLRRKYKFATGPQQTYFDRQFLSLSAFFNSLPTKKVQKVDKIAEMPDLNPFEMVEEEDQEQNVEMMQLQQRRLFRHRLNPEPQVEQLIVPLPAPQPKEEDKDKQVQKEQENQHLEPVVLKCEQFIDGILEKFEQYLSFDIEVASKFNLKEIIMPQGAVTTPKFTLGFLVKFQEVLVDVELRVKKLAGFQKRIGEIYAIICPKGEWQIKKENNDQRQSIGLSRRLFESLGNPLELNRQNLVTLERLLQGRHLREEAANNNPPVRNLNIADIYQQLEEFTAPIVPPQPPRQQPMDIEQPNSEGNVENPLSEVLPVQAQQQIQPHPVAVVPQGSSQQLQNPQPQVALIENNPHLAEDQVQLQPPQYQLLEEHPIEQVEEVPPIQVSVDIANLSVQSMVIEAVQIPANINEHQPQEANINPVPISNVAIQNPPAQQEAQQPPPRQRQILTMLGLAQTFLRDVGLDQEFFDSLPEDLQQEQLITFMAQQGANVNRRQGDGSNPPANQPQDLASQNVAFLDSLDAHTRAQVLLEATPQFLTTLPPNIREQAQRHRSLQINRIIEEQQIEEQRNYIVQQGRPKQPLVYPKILKSQFSKMSEDTGRYLFKGIFNIYPKFKLTSLKLLLQNKQVQHITIASIIALLHAFEERHESNKKWNANKVQVINKEITVSEGVQLSHEDIEQIRIQLLHTILQHLKIPLYKDDQFLGSKIGNQVYLEELLIYLKDQPQIDPIIELSPFALNYYPDLATQLLKKAKDLPDQLFKQIVLGIRKEQWPSEFYDSLANFSQNQRLRQIFEAQFQQKSPKIEILGKLLKYKFAQLSSLKNIHQQALEYYSPSYIEFLNQIFSIYSIETLNDIEPLLLKHKATHFQVIKSLYQQGRQLDKEPIGLILKKPHLIDFQTKKFIFRNHPKLRRLSGRRVHIEVDRTHLFQGSYNQLMNRTVRELQGKITVAFINQPGYDAGGLRREWFLLVSRQIFNQNYALFEKSSSGNTYQPNPKSYINPDHLNYFKFIGRFIGKALVEKELIDAYFTRAFYKMILGQQLQFKDLEAQDYEFYKSMEWLKNNPVDENTFTFSYIYDNFGNKVQKQIIPGGKTIIVNQENKIDYIEKYCMSKMRDDFTTQINKFLEGFHEVVPQECISFFEAKELELLVSGVPEVDIEDFKKNTDYSGYNPADQIIIWFWEVVSEYSQEDLAKLVQFITGSSKIPVEGFSHMIGMNGIQRISVHRDPMQHQLPKAHTCFNQLDLPNYATKEILKQKLGICLAWGSQGFGFM